MLETIPVLAQVTLVALVAAGALLWRQARSWNEKNMPYVSSQSTVSFIQTMFGPQGPFFLLDLVRSKGRSIFAITRQFYVVADATIGLEILNNPQSLKWEGYSFFDQVMGGPNFFSKEGQRAKHVRKSTTLAFADTDRMKAVIDEVLEEWIQSFLEPRCIEMGNPLDIQEEMMHLTLNIMGRLAFDYQFEYEERCLVIESFALAYSEVSSTNVFRFLKATRWIFPNVRRALAATRRLNDFCRKILQSPVGTGGSSILQAMRDDSGYANDDERVYDMCVFLAAGFDTTAYTLVWTLLELAKHPKEQRILRDDLRGGSEEELGRVRTESMRLHAVSGLGVFRAISKDMTIPGDHVMPKGSVCLVSPFLIHRDGSVFPSPDDFVPSRWIDPTDDQRKAFLPYVCGRRNCIGQSLANLEVLRVIGRLGRDYEFHVIAEGEAFYNVTFKTKGTILGVRKTS